jgi:PAS domain S-box-containing protein
MPKPLNILLVEDLEDDALLLLRELRRGGYSPVHERVETAEAMRAALEQRQWDIVISDYLMPKFSGLAALSVLHDSGQDLPFIIVSGNIGEDIAVQAMKAGAHDYVIKGNLARLLPAVERELREAEVRRERIRADEQLTQSRQRLFNTLENMNEGFFTLDAAWQFTFVNREAAKLWGISRVELLGRSLWDVAPAAVGSIFEEQYKKAVHEQVPVRFEALSPIVGIWVEVRAHPSERGLAVYFHDITERKQSGERIARLNRLYAVLSKVNEAIIRIHDAGTLYQEVCRITVEVGLFKMAWVGLVDPETKRVSPVASHGDDKGYLDDIKIIAADMPEGRGPTGRAAFSGNHVICADIEHDPVMRPWREKTLAHGFRSSSAFPLRTGPSITGVLTVYADRPRSFSEEEISLLSSLAEDVSFALESLANERKRREAEERISVTNDLLKLFTQKFTRQEYLDAACGLIREWSGLHHVGIRIADPDNKIPFASCKGYDDAFLEKESALSLIEDHCICTRVIAGTPEPPDRSFLTPRGSFYSGDAVNFVENLRDEERDRYRGACMKYGFRSLAVIPVRYREEPIGAIHLADEREGMLDEKAVEFLEQLSYIVGEAVFRFGIEDNLRKNLDHLQRTSEELKLSFSYNRSLIESSLDPLVTIGLDGTITDVNAATEMATGRLRNELIGTDFSSYFTEPEKARSGYQQAFREGKVIGYSLEIRHRNGQVTPVLYNASLFRDAAGSVMGVFVAARDITELKEAEQRSEVTNNLLKLFTHTYSREEYLDATVEIIRSWCGCKGVGLRIADRDGNIPYAASAGFDAGFIASEGGLSLGRDRCACTRVVAGTPDPLDAATMTPNGSLYYSNAVEFLEKLTDQQKKQFRGVCQQSGYKSLAVVPVRYRDRVFGAIHLADEREGLFPLSVVQFVEQLALIIGEAMLRFNVEEESARLVSAVESSADAVVITDTKGFIRYVNPAFEQITGYSKEEAERRDLHFLDSGKHDEQFYAHIREAVQRDGVWRGLLVNKKKDGMQYHEDCTISPVRAPSGEILNYVSLKRDVTEKLRLESIAESVNTMDNIGYIFSGVRHEIGNPINSINMIIGILKSKLPALSREAVQDYLDRVMGQIERMEFLLQSLKSFNMYETQESQDLRVHAYMEQFLPLVKLDFEKKGIELDLALDPDADRLYADPRALQQVLLNVLTNAADAVQGRERPRVSLGVSRSGGRVRIEVEDNGYGIPEDKMKDLFKPFYTTKAHGTGLGLVIVRKMLNRMNGTIELESRGGLGTLVTISLPEGKHEQG